MSRGIESDNMTELLIAVSQGSVSANKIINSAFRESNRQLMNDPAFLRPFTKNRRSDKIKK